MPENQGHPVPSAPALFLSGKGFLRLSGLLLLYFAWCILMLPASAVIPAMLLPGFPLLLFAVPDPKKWLLLLPLAVSIGYREMSVGVFPVFLSVVFMCAGYVVYLLGSLAGDNTGTPDRRFALLVALAYLAQVASLLTSVHVNGQHPMNAFRESHKYFIHAPMAFIVMTWYREDPWFHRMLKALVVTLLAVSIYGIYQFHSGAAWSVGEVASGYDIQGRVFSTFRGGANSYSGFLELVVPLVLASSFHFRERGWRITGFVTAALGVLNGLYTYSRGGFITISLACLAYLIYRFRKKVWVPFLSLAAFSGVVASNADTFQRQLVLITDPTSMVLEATLLHRYVSYSRFIEDISANPIFGVGWGAREYYAGGSSLYSFWEVRHERSIDHIEHFGGLNSLVFDMILKGGIASGISLVLIAITAGYVAVKAYRRRGDGDLPVGIVMGLLAFVAHQTVDNLLQWPQTGAFFWISLGLLAVIAGQRSESPYISAEHDGEDAGATQSPLPTRE